jgi:hypothetical protein
MKGAVGVAPGVSTMKPLCNPSAHLPVAGGFKYARIGAMHSIIGYCQQLTVGCWVVSAATDY